MMSIWASGPQRMDTWTLADQPDNRRLPVVSSEHRPRQRRMPVPFNWNLAQEICERHASGETLTSILSDEGMPTWWTLNEVWARDELEFSKLLARARELWVERKAHEIHDIADRVNLREVREYTYDTKNGNKMKITAVDQVERDKLRVFVRKMALDAYVNHPGRKDDPPGGEQALPGLNVTVNHGWDTDE